jgi:glycosyltransferase involved in cell wall biosynthesis
MKLSIVIPCLNEIETIEKVTQDAKTYADQSFPNDYEIVVADNGSTDGTLDVLKKLSYVRTVHVPVRGYGAALHWGITHAKGEYVLFGDADMSYPFSNIPAFKEAMKSNADMILGSRLRGSIEAGAMPFLNRHLGTPVLTFLIRMIYKIPTSDCNSGMRMIRRTFYDKLGMKYSGMEWASELLVRTALMKGSFYEISIDFKKDQRNRPPHLRRWADGWRHLKSIMFMKPACFYPIIVALLAGGAMSYFGEHFEVTYLLLSLAFVLFMSVIALKLMNSTLEKRQGLTVKLLGSFGIVQISLFVVGGLLAAIFLLPPERLGTKLILSGFLGIYFLWLFLIEVIKTNLLNRLPEHHQISEK